MRTWPWLLLLLCLPAGPTPAAEDAAASGAHALLRAAFENLYAEDYVQTLRLTTRIREGRPMSRLLQVTRKQSERPGKALVRFLEPQAVRRTSILVLENDGGSDDHYVYLPAARRTRHLSAAQRADSFFGTDLSYEDIEPKHAEDWNARFAGRDHVAGLDCTLLEVTPRPGHESAYSLMRTCIEPARAIMLRTEFERPNQPGVTWKRLEIDPTAVERVGSRNIPFRMRVETPRRRSETLVLTERYELAPDIPDRIFSVVNLENGDAERDRIRSAGGNDGLPDVAAPPPE